MSSLLTLLKDFQDSWSWLCQSRPHGGFTYSGDPESFGSLVNKHFAKYAQDRIFGVYVIRSTRTSEVLYVGKAGAVMFSGEFKSQDIPRRLKNVKENDMPAEEWFSSLLAEKGNLTIEYLALDTKPISPSLAERLLLQAYLNQHGSLPYRNKEL